MIQFKNNTVLLLMILSVFGAASLSACSGSADNGQTASDSGEDHGDDDEIGRAHV